MIKKPHRHLFLWMMLLLLVLVALLAILHQPPEAKWREEFDDQRNITTLLYDGHSILSTTGTSSALKDEAFAFLESNSKLRLNVTNLYLAKNSCESEKSNKKSICSLSFIQKHKSLPVWSSQVLVVIINGEIVHVRNNYFPAINVSVTPTLSKTVAEDIAREALSTNLSAKSVNLIIFPHKNEKGYIYYLSWAIKMPSSYDNDGRMHAYTFFVDAHTGKIIEKLDHITPIMGKITGKVFLQNPQKEMQVEMPFAGESITAEEKTVVTNSFGEYDINVPEGTIIESQLKGPFAEVFESIFLDAEVTTKADYESTNPSWNWGIVDSSYKQEESNVFYHLNIIHDFFNKGYPFEIPALNYPRKSYVQWGGPLGKESCNAYASCDYELTSEGSPPIDKVATNFFLAANDQCESTALLSDTIYHEYTHGVICHVYEWMLDPYWGETGSMNEGLADYFAATMNKDSCIDDFKYNSDCLRNIKNNLKYPEDYYPEPHTGSGVFSASLWDLREMVGGDVTDELVITTMKEFQPQTFQEFVIALLTLNENQVFYVGTSYAKDICHAFYDNHGIKTLSCLGFTEFPIAIITSPQPQELNFVMKEERIIILGTAYGSEDPLKKYTLEFTLYGMSGEEWSNEGIIMTGGNVIDNVLAVWNISSIPNGVYTLRLTVLDAANKTSSATVNIQIDRNIHGGWPKKAVYSNSPTLGDVNNDSVQDIVTNSGKEVHIWSSNGSDIIGWPQLTSNSIGASLALGDIDGDGFLEVVGATPNEIYVWENNGSLFDGNEDGTADWPKPAGSSSNIGTSTPVLADLDEDGFLEVIIGGSGESKVYVFSRDGTIFSGWPKETAGMIITTAAVGDLDKAYPGKEIIVTSFDKKVYAWHADGTNVPGWPQEVTYSLVRSSPTLGDLNNDGKLEVVLAAGAVVYVWAEDGTVMWKKQLDTFTTSSVALGDLDDDGNLEVVIPSGDNLYIWSSKGELLGKWPLYSHLSSSALGDIDEDDELEIVVGSYDKKLYAFNRNGSLVSGWPKITSGVFSQSPAIGDVDGDGKVEVVAGSFDQYMYVWDISANYKVKKVEWPQFHHDAQHTGLYQFECSEPYDDFLVNESVTLCPGTYSINDSGYSGVIKINADNLELNCHGATIIGNGTGRGIYNVGHKNVTIKNCIVKNYTNGIYLYLAKNNYIRSNIALGNDWSGIYLTNSNNSFVNDNVVGGNHHGIGLFFSNNNFISSNNVSLNNNIGIYLKYSLKNTILNNFANTNAYGIDLHGSSNYNLVSNNTADYNLYFGLSLDTSDSNVLVNNNADYNYYGLFMESADKNSLKQNNFTHNQYGIRLISGSKENKATNNLACFNILEDISVKDGNFGNYGEKNTCTDASNWEESGKIGCTYSC